MNDPDRLLTLLGERIDELETAMSLHAEKDAALRHWEALQATKMQGEGMSAAASEKAVRALDPWYVMYLETENAKVAVEVLKHRIRLGQNYFEKWRSINSQLKKTMNE